MVIFNSYVKLPEGTCLHNEKTYEMEKTMNMNVFATHN